MLILTRKANERVFIGDGISLVVLSIENNRIKLGIEAPADTPILREEIVDDETITRIDANLRSYSNIDKSAPVKRGAG